MELALLERDEWFLDTDEDIVYHRQYSGEEVGGEWLSWKRDGKEVTEEVAEQLETLRQARGD